MKSWGEYVYRFAICKLDAFEIFIKLVRQNEFCSGEGRKKVQLDHPASFSMCFPSEVTVPAIVSGL